MQMKKYLQIQLFVIFVICKLHLFVFLVTNIFILISKTYLHAFFFFSQRMSRPLKCVWLYVVSREDNLDNPVLVVYKHITSDDIISV